MIQIVVKYLVCDLTKIVLDEKKILVIVTKSVERMPYVKPYHLYKPLYIPVLGECLLN